MSIKNNTTSLQNLLEQVNALPEAENLDTEISTQTTLLSEQDAKIAELAEILASKAGGSLLDRKKTKLTIIIPEDNFIICPIFHYTFNSILTEVNLERGITTIEVDQNTIGVFEGLSSNLQINDTNNIVSAFLSGMNFVIVYCTESDATISFIKI